jgi:hypothetical protein
MLDKNYASTVKFSMLACLLMDAWRSDDAVSRRLWDRKNDLSMDWFDRLIDFELGKAIESIGQRDAAFVKNISSLLVSLSGGDDYSPAT